MLEWKDGRNNCNCGGALVAWDHPDPVDDDAALPRPLDHGIFSNDSATTNNWDFDLARDEHRIPFPTDVVGIFYPLAPLDTRDYWVDSDGNSNCCVGGGRVDFERGAKVI